VTRHPNPHIGVRVRRTFLRRRALARLEATVMFEELLRRFPGLELVGEVDRMRATMVPGSSGCRCGWDLTDATRLHPRARAAA